MINQLSNLQFIIGSAFIFFFLYAMIKQRSRNATLFSAMCLAVAIFVIGYGFELRSSSYEELAFYLKMQYFGAPFMTVFWFLFSYKFYYNRSASFRMTVAIMVIPVLTLFFSVTNEYHHLLYKSVQFLPDSPYAKSELVRGPWYYLYSYYSYAMILYGSALFFRIWQRAEHQMKKQAFLMFTGTLWPVAVNIVYLFGFSPYGLDLTPFGLILLALCYYLALFKYGFLELQEIVKSVTFSEIDDGIIVVDGKQRLIDYNEAARKVFSWLETRNIGLRIDQFEGGRKMLAFETAQFVLECVHDSDWRAFEFRRSELKEHGKQLGEVYFFHDITEQRHMIDKLNELASYDALSQVYNRRKLLEEAEKESHRAVRYYDFLSVLMIDIDHFKRVNDVYGHLAGDEVIRRVAAASKHRVRSIDIVGRYGGEEFVIILANACQQSALQIAEELRRDIEALDILYEGNHIQVTVSVGVAGAATKPADDTAGESPAVDIVQLINKADAAMYNAKKNGRNQVSL